MTIETLTCDELPQLTIDQINDLLTKCAARINELHHLLDSDAYTQELDAKLSAEWRSIVVVRKTLYARLEELQGDAFLPAQAA